MKATTGCDFRAAQYGRYLAVGELLPGGQGDDLLLVLVQLPKGLNEVPGPVEGQGLGSSGR